MNRLFFETGHISLLKYKEELCGDCVETASNSEATTLVLADGLGSGVKANILSTLTAKIICTMMANGMPVEECVSTITQTLPVCSVRQLAYSTFTIIQINNNMDVDIIQFDNPDTILLRKGKSVPYPVETKEIFGKKISQTRIKGEVGDMFITMSDGAIYAGVGSCMNFGWQREHIVEYAQEKYKPDISAKMMAVTIAEACRDLYDDKPGDDTTIAAIRIRERLPVNLMIGPPVNKEDDEKVMELFFSKEGKKVVCGGTTSTLVSRYLDKPVMTEINYADPTIPPIGKIEGVDLVTEGVLTMGRVLEIARMYNSTSDFSSHWRKKADGASRICKILFEDATDVNFFVGRAQNPAHQNPQLPLDLSLKLRLIEELQKCLENMGKSVKVSYY